jgi:tRNA-dihydrouridine synthase B
VFAETLADGIMIGRAAVGKPYIFRQIREYFETGQYATPTVDEIKGYMLEFARIFLERSGKKDLKDVGGALVQYIKGFHDSKSYRFRLANIMTYDELVGIVDEWRV